MESLAAPVSTVHRSPSIFTHRRSTTPARSNVSFPHLSRFPVFCSCKNGNNGSNSEDPSSPDSSESTTLIPLFKGKVSFSHLSKDEAMGLVLRAATGRGWTTDSGMEGPSVPAAATDDRLESASERVSTFPWSLFTKSPRRRMRVAFTCNVCGQRTTRAINPHAYTDGTVFVQCAGCDVIHKLIDNLNLFHEVKGYGDPKFNKEEDMPFGYLNIDDFPLP